MSDPKYNKYAGTIRFDDDNIVDINLQPDTENITVKLNGSEITGGSDLPEVDSGDNGKVLTVVSGEWAAATPASPYVVNIAGTGGGPMSPVTWSSDKKANEIIEAVESGLIPIAYVTMSGNFVCLAYFYQYFANAENNIYKALFGAVCPKDDSGTNTLNAACYSVIDESETTTVEAIDMYFTEATQV